MDTKRELNIAYFMIWKWPYQIRNILNDKQKKSFFRSTLPDFETTIYRKVKQIQFLIKNARQEIRGINIILRERREEVDEHIEKGTAISLTKDIARVYLICAYIEASLIQMVAVIDLINSFISTFFWVILNKKKRLADIIEMMREDNISLDWIARVKFYRRVVVHAYTGWPCFEQINGHFVVSIKFPKSIRRMKEYATFQSDSLDTKVLNELFESFNKYFHEVLEWLLSQIKGD